jgi:hypothetical protein
LGKFATFGAKGALVAVTISAEQLVSMLDTAPERLAAASRGLSAAQLATRPAPEEWSANEVLAHLRACADVWGRSISTILGEDRPTIRAINPRTWIERTDYLQQAFGPSLQAFTAQRVELIAQLRRLAPEDWAREATITGAGRPLTGTVLSYAERLAVHERPHLKQVDRVAQVISRLPAESRGRVRR